jgi:hypothetical protein
MTMLMRIATCLNVTGRLCAVFLCLLRLMAEWYKGYDPHGQFYLDKVESYGIGVSLGF